MSTEAKNNLGDEEGEETMLIKFDDCGIPEQDELPAHTHLAHFGAWRTK